MSAGHQVLQEALQRALAQRSGSGPRRFWYGPGEARDAATSALKNWAVDAYGSWLWITEWESPGSAETGALGLETRELTALTEQVYVPRGFKGAVVLRRPRGTVPSLPEVLWGHVPEERFEVTEGGLRFWIRLLGTRHPGLFLDHERLRRWLVESGACSGKTVLNTFAYTGSLSVAAFAGGADSVVTLDLSKPTLAWARENIELNGVAPERASFIAGDFFEEIPRLKRRGQRFGVVISDPPSFSRGKKGGKKGSFSTQKDLVRLHEQLLSVLEPGGVLVSSINSANVSVRQFEEQVLQAARNLGCRLERVARIEQPESFPVWKGEPRSGYLKGVILLNRPGSLHLKASKAVKS